MTGLSRSTVNRRIGSGEFKTIKIGSVPLITAESLRALSLLDD